MFEYDKISNRCNSLNIVKPLIFANLYVLLTQALNVTSGAYEHSILLNSVHSEYAITHVSVSSTSFKHHFFVPKRINRFPIS